MKTAVLAPSPARLFRDRPLNHAPEFNTACAALTRAVVRGDDRRGVLEIAAYLLFGVCALLSVAGSARASLALTRSDALHAVVLRALPQQCITAQAAPAAASQPL